MDHRHPLTQPLLKWPQLSKRKISLWQMLSLVVLRISDTAIQSVLESS